MTPAQKIALLFDDNEAQIARWGRSGLAAVERLRGSEEAPPPSEAP